MKKWLLKPPSLEEFLRLLTAWRVWAAGAVVGAAVAALVYIIVPPQYRAQATVLVDQHVEQVIPVERSELLIYTYLQRETDKLVELAWSDQVLSQLSNQTGIPVASLRDGRRCRRPAQGVQQRRRRTACAHTARPSRVGRCGPAGPSGRRRAPPRRERRPGER